MAKYYTRVNLDLLANDKLGCKKCCNKQSSLSLLIHVRKYRLSYDMLLAYHMTNGIFKHVYEAISQSVCCSIFYNLVWYLPVSQDLPQCSTWPCQCSCHWHKIRQGCKSFHYFTQKCKLHKSKILKLLSLNMKLRQFPSACTIKLFTLVIITVDCKLAQLSMLAFYTLV